MKWSYEFFNVLPNLTSLGSIWSRILSNESLKWSSSLLDIFLRKVKSYVKTTSLPMISYISIKSVHLCCKYNFKVQFGYHSPFYSRKIGCKFPSQSIIFAAVAFHFTAQFVFRKRLRGMKRNAIVKNFSCKNCIKVNLNHTQWCYLLKLLSSAKRFNWHIFSQTVHKSVCKIELQTNVHRDCSQILYILWQL